MNPLASSHSCSAYQPISTFAPSARNFLLTSLPKGPSPPTIMATFPLRFTIHPPFLSGPSTSQIVENSLSELVLSWLIISSLLRKCPSFPSHQLRISDLMLQAFPFQALPSSCLIPSMHTM